MTRLTLPNSDIVRYRPRFWAPLPYEERMQKIALYVARWLRAPEIDQFTLVPMQPVPQRIKEMS